MLVTTTNTLYCCVKGKRFLPSAAASLVCLLAITFLLIPTLPAQLLYGGINGTVTDASGAVIAGAQITALNTQTGVSANTTTDSAGIYRFATLTPGAYSVTYEAKGFGKQQKTGIQVAGGEIAEENVQLTVGTASESVTVTTAPAILQTEKADVHTDISSQDRKSVV